MAKLTNEECAEKAKECIGDMCFICYSGELELLEDCRLICNHCYEEFYIDYDGELVREVYSE